MPECALCSRTGARGRAISECCQCELSKLGKLNITHVKCLGCNRRCSADCIALMHTAATTMPLHHSVLSGQHQLLDAYVDGSISSILRVLQQDGQRAATVAVHNLSLSSCVSVLGFHSISTACCPLCAQLTRTVEQYHFQAEAVCLLQKLLCVHVPELLQSGIDAPLHCVYVDVRLYLQVWTRAAMHA